MHQQQLLNTLKSMNDLQQQFSAQAAALELILIGLMRAIGQKPEATLEIERAIAQFAGDAPTDHKAAAIARAQRILSAAYEPPPPKQK